MRNRNSNSRRNGLIALGVTLGVMLLANLLGAPQPVMILVTVCGLVAVAYMMLSSR